jgi:hypothetical protein
LLAVCVCVFWLYAHARACAFFFLLYRAVDLSASVLMDRSADSPSLPTSMRLSDNKPTTRLVQLKFPRAPKWVEFIWIHFRFTPSKFIRLNWLSPQNIVQLSFLKWRNV